MSVLLRAIERETTAVLIKNTLVIFSPLSDYENMFRQCLFPGCLSHRPVSISLSHPEGEHHEKTKTKASRSQIKCLSFKRLKKACGVSSILCLVFVANTKFPKAEHCH